MSRERRPAPSGWAALLAFTLAVALPACRADPGLDIREPATPRAAAGPPQGRGSVLRVRDGDSLVVALDDGRRLEVRLQGIDAPEARQEGGRESAEHLRRLALGRKIELRLLGVDRFGRHLAVATGARGDLGLLQIEAGHAWHGTLYADEQDREARQRYAAAERAAREARLGLWSAPAPTAPWDFKADRRARAVPDRPGAGDARDGRIVGNSRSRLYHLPGCPGHAAVSPGNAVLFESEQEAAAAGFQRASNC